MSVNTKVNGQLVKSAGLYKASVPIQSGDIYSFEERQVGVFADGKPLYQKTVLTGALSAGNNNITMGLDNPENIVDINIIAFTSNVTAKNIPLTYVNTGTISGYGATSDGYNFSTDEVLITLGNDRSFTGGYITIQYTKTTDVAGSGEYVPSGDKAVHYDDTEQVIGTWFGETLYRKTVNFGALPNNATKNVAHGISNLKYIKSYEGTAKSTSNGYYLTLPYIHSTSASKYVEMYFDATNISVVTKEDRSVYDICYITLEYTKTS